MIEQGLFGRTALIRGNWKPTIPQSNLYSKLLYLYMPKRFDISESLLRDLYIEQNKDAGEISKEVGCAPSLISYYLNKFNIPRKLKIKDISGNRYGKLLAVSFVEVREGNAVWFCTCDCGGIIEVHETNLEQHRVSSCGCLRSDVKKTHALSNSRQYHIWQGMKTRCGNPNAINYNEYGGRGITYDPKWEIFEGFWEDMKPGYSDNLTIERIDSNRGYSKDNCKWVTYSEQNFHRRTWKKEIGYG